MNIWGLPKITANRNVVTPALDSAFRKIHVNPTSLNNFSLSWNPWMHCWNIDSRSTLSYLSSAQSLHHQDPCSYPVLPQGGAAGVLVVERLYSGRRSLGSHRHLQVVYGLSQWQQLRKQKNTPGWVIYSKWDWDTRDVFELISIPLICYLSERTEQKKWSKSSSIYWTNTDTFRFLLPTMSMPLPGTAICNWVKTYDRVSNMKNNCITNNEYC